MLREASTLFARVALLGLVALFVALVIEQRTPPHYSGVAEALDTLNSRQPAKGH